MGQWHMYLKRRIQLIWFMLTNIAKPGNTVSTTGRCCDGHTVETRSISVQAGKQASFLC